MWRGLPVATGAVDFTCAPRAVRLTGVDFRSPPSLLAVSSDFAQVQPGAGTMQTMQIISLSGSVLQQRGFVPLCGGQQGGSVGGPPPLLPPRFVATSVVGCGFRSMVSRSQFHFSFWRAAGAAKVAPTQVDHSP